MILSQAVTEGDQDDRSFYVSPSGQVVYSSPAEVCGYKRNPRSTRPPCNKRAGHGGTHSYTPKSR